MIDRPIIQITEPEVIEKGNETIYDYDKSHVIYKMQDLGSFAELQKMKAANQKYKEIFDKAIAHLDLFILSENLSEYDTLKILMHTKKILSEVERLLKEVK